MYVIGFSKYNLVNIEYRLCTHGSTVQELTCSYDITKVTYNLPDECVDFTIFSTLAEANDTLDAIKKNREVKFVDMDPFTEIFNEKKNFTADKLYIFELLVGERV